jgi:hypothetical protein
MSVEGRRHGYRRARRCCMTTVFSFFIAAGELKPDFKRECYTPLIAEAH